MNKPILSVKNISKSYPGVLALNNFSLDIYPGEIHALLGENGAGKSTLIKSISGAIDTDSGTFLFNEDQLEVTKVTPDIASKYKIEVVYQEFNLLSSLTVAENISFGTKLGKLVNYKEMHNIAKKAIEIFDVEIDPRSRVYSLPTSKQQIVEISKAITKDAKILIMDEPTAPLSISEVKNLFEVLNELRKNGVAIIYITHRIEEIFEIADKVTVMRDGEYINTYNTKESNRELLVNSMVGRELKEVFPDKEYESDEVILQVKDFNGNGLKNITFDLKKGEILGFAGLVGSGRTEMVRMLYGADKKDSGVLFVKNSEVHSINPKKAIELNIGFVPEDRKTQGCLLNRDLSTNITLSILPRISKLGVINRKLENEITKKYMNSLDIRTPNEKQLVGNLSGGNQQKVVISKTLAAESEIIIFDEPTRGIDVGAKQEIYKLITNLAEQGKSIILISSEMEEIIGLSDRLMVLYEGEIYGELEKEELNQELIINIASGLRKEELNNEQVISKF